MLSLSPTNHGSVLRNVPRNPTISSSCQRNGLFDLRTMLFMCNTKGAKIYHIGGWGDTKPTISPRRSQVASVLQVSGNQSNMLVEYDGAM